MRAGSTGRIDLPSRKGIGLDIGGGGVNLRSLPNLALLADAKDFASMVMDSAKRVALLGDLSGNSTENQLILPGTGYASTPHASALNGAELDLRLDFTMDDYTPSAEQMIVSKYAVGQARFIVSQATDGTFVFYYSTNGTDLIGIAKDYFGGAPADRSRQRLRITYKNGETIKFYYGTSFNTWTLYDAEPDPGAVISNSTAALQIGTYLSGTSNMVGKMHRVQIRSNVLDDGTGIVFDSDFSLPAKLATSFTESSTNAATVTIATGARITGARDLYQATDANKPVYLPWSGTHYGYLNGASGACFSTPDSAATSPAGDFFIAVKAALVDWTPSARQILASKYNATGNQRSWWLSIETDGKVALNTSVDGTATVNCISSVAPTITDLATKWIGAFFDADNGAAGRAVTFYTSDDNSTWTQLGTVVTTATASGLFDSTASFILGASDAGAANMAMGNVFYGYLAATVGGTPTVSFNPALYTSGATFTAATGEVWTVNGGAMIVTRTGLLFNGSSNYLASALFPAISQPGSVYIAGSQLTWTSNDKFLDSASANRWVIAQTNGGASPSVSIFAGSASTPSITALALQVFGIIGAVFNGASSTLRLNKGTASTGNPGSNTYDSVCLGSTSAATYGNIFVTKLLIFSVAHDQATQDMIINQLAAEAGLLV